MSLPCNECEINRTIRMVHMNDKHFLQGSCFTFVKRLEKQKERLNLKDREPPRCIQRS